MRRITRTYYIHRPPRVQSNGITRTTNVLESGDTGGHIIQITYTNQCYINTANIQHTNRDTSHRLIERVSSSSSSGRLGGGGGRKVSYYLIFTFSCPSSPSHYIVGLITGGLELLQVPDGTRHS